MADFKPTLGNKPTNKQSKAYTKTFNNALRTSGVKNLNEVDELLSEVEQSLKKKIFSLAKMEALVFSDPKLSAIYDEMSVNGEEKYGYHYNETIQNMIFNDYVLNSPKYLQKYKQAIPKEKKRRDASGINQLKKAGEEKMKTRNIEPKPAKPVTEGDEPLTKVQFLVKQIDADGNTELFAYFPEEEYNDKYKWGYSHNGQHSAVHPEYAAESRPATPEEYADLKVELEGQGYNLDVLNGVAETTGSGGAGGAGAFSGSGQYTAPLGYDKKVDETTGSASSGAYVGPAVWGSGDLMKTKGKANVKKVPMVKGGTIIQESNYLIETDGFEKFIESLNEDFDREDSPMKETPSVPVEISVGLWDKTAPGNGIAAKSPVGTDTKRAEDIINNNSSEFSSGAVENWSEEDKEVELNTIKTGQPDKPNLETMEENVNEEAQSMIGDSPDTMANKPMPVGQQSSNMDMGARSSGGMNESYEKLLEEINNELDAFSIHHNKLKRMAEDRKPSALILKDRMGVENKANFKKDLKDSSVAKIVDIENSLEYADQQTEVGDPQKLGAEIEAKAIKTGDMKSGEALKNVGDSANDKGDEIPKRNLTQEEQDEVNMYRFGLGDLVYDNEVGKRFEDRMKADMGDKLYKQRQDKLKLRAEAPMYNKESQPTQKTAVDKVQFDKEKSGWNEREGIKEGFVTGKYFDILGKKRIMDFNLNEVLELKATSTRQSGLYEVSLEGLGNTYTQKVSVNEGVVKAINKFKFFTNGTDVFAWKAPVQNLSETEQKAQKPAMNEQMVKMKHLVGYNTNDFVKQSKL